MPLFNTYTIAFTDRLKGAIGIFERHSVKVQAADPAAALLKAYDTHEHIQHVRMTEHRNGIEYAVHPREYGR